MAYIYENTNTLRVQCINISTGSVYKTLLFDANCTFDLKDESKTYENWNHKILVDNVGTRMIINASIINRTNINTQLYVLSLFECINLIKNNTHKFKIWPSWKSTYAVHTMDSFECTIDGAYDNKKLHKFINSGNTIIIKFIELVPNKNYVPKIPRLEEEEPSVWTQSSGM